MGFVVLSTHLRLSRPKTGRTLLGGAVQRYLQLGGESLHRCTRARDSGRGSSTSSWILASYNKNRTMFLWKTIPYES